MGHQRLAVVLNVAEKPSVAKELVKHLATAGTTVQKCVSYSKWNPVTQFEGRFRDQPCTMIVMSVRGISNCSACPRHLIELEFPQRYRNWKTTDPFSLLSAPLEKNVKTDSRDLDKTLRHYAKLSTALALWLDCDREGENISFEVIEICLAANPSLAVYRAQFSALTYEALQRACARPRPPDPLLSMAVSCRQEIDLRTGAALTRFLTLRYKEFFDPSLGPLSFGPCQFPTMGLVVTRYLDHEAFETEKFWTLDLRVLVHSVAADVTIASCEKRTLKREKLLGPRHVDFHWDRGRLFDKDVVETFEMLCHQALDKPKVTHVQERRVTKRRPLPLSTRPGVSPDTTTELTVLASKKLHLSSKRTMQYAELLYQRGFISYPRTETDQFHPSMNLRALVDLQRTNEVWGHYASELLDRQLFLEPRRGQRDDKAHPPIHPVRTASKSQMTSEDHWRVFHLIVAHFLACCSNDAEGIKMHVTLSLANEQFHASGLTIVHPNFLTIYSEFDPWTESNPLPFNYVQIGQIVPNARLRLVEGCTTPPPLLSEAELVRAMDKYGIGTDATMHDHIQTIQDRGYVVKRATTFCPTSLGLRLAKGFTFYTSDDDDDKFDLIQPMLRALMECDLALIATGEKNKCDVVQCYLNKFEKIVRRVVAYPEFLDRIMLCPDPPVVSTSPLALPPFEFPETVNAHVRPIADVVLRQSLTTILDPCFSFCSCGERMDLRSRGDACDGVAFRSKGSSSALRGQSTNRKLRGGKRTKVCKLKQRPQGSALRSGASTKRYLVCTNKTSVCPVLLLPSSGLLKPYNHQCPLCRYQVLHVTNSTSGATHFLCPYCYSHPPVCSNASRKNTVGSGDIEDIPAASHAFNGFRCFLCTNKANCSLATG